MHNYRRLIRYAWQEWRTLLAILGLTAGFSLITALQPWPLKLLVDYGLGHAPVAETWRRLLPLEPTAPVLIGAAAVAGLVLFLLNSALDVGLTWAWTAAGQRMVYALAADLFRRFQRLSLQFHTRRSVGDSLSRLTGDAWCVYTVTEALLVAPVQHTLTVVMLGVVAWRLDPGLAALALAVAPVLGVSAVLFGRRLKQRARINREAQSRLLSFVHQTLQAMPVVQAFGVEQRNRQEFGRLAEDVVVVSQRETVVKNAFGIVNGTMTTVGLGLLLYVGGQRVLAGALSLGGLLVLLGYLRSLQNAFQGLLSIYGNLKSAEASIDRVLEVFAATEEVPEPAQPAALPTVAGHVRLENVTFGYEPGQPFLKGVSLEARPGETVALVGPTGAGKSTLAALIPRLLDPWEGRVTLDGVDVRTVRLAELRGQVALVLQEPFLLPLTVAQNIAYGRPGARREEVEAAAVAANAAEFIRQLPQGYDTVLGERGATLSGGQRQRLSIARALLKNAPVLILDEPTSALDAETEAQVMGALERLMKGRTTFIIAHRLSTVRRADRIVVLEAGRVVETGRHEELLRARGAYYRLYSQQFPTEVGA